MYTMPVCIMFTPNFGQKCQGKPNSLVPCTVLYIVNERFKAWWQMRKIEVFLDKKKCDVYTPLFIIIGNGYSTLGSNSGWACSHFT